MSGDSYAVQLAPPDIGAYRAGNTGIPYVTTLDSGRPGPHVMVNALTHGNELCGAIAVVTLFERGVRPLKGKLTLSFANVAAFEAFDPARPSESRFVDEDFNRLWDEATLEGPRDSVELRRARELRPVVDTVDLLLDIHSMQHRTPPLMMAGMTGKAVALARQVAIPELIVCDAGHAAGRRMRDYRGFGDETSPRNALLIECGQHWERRSAEVAIETTYRFLAATGTIDATQAPSAPAPPQRVIEVTDAVTVSSDRFRFAAPYRGLEVIPQAGTAIAHDGETPVLTPYPDCVLIMPSRRLVPGQTAVRLGRFRT
jgi:predicted deacylase